MLRIGLGSGPCDFTQLGHKVAFDAFISYSSKDKAAADATCAVLEASGVRCWIAPRDIRTGAEYGGAIIEAIDHCRVMILVFSSSANASQQIHREIERAVSKGVPILPVRIEEVTPTKSMEYFLGAIHWLDAMSPPLEEHLHKLGDTVKAMLKADAIPGDGSGSDLQKPSVAAAIGAVELLTQRAEQVKPAVAAKHLPAEKPLRPKWLFPAIGGAFTMLLIAGGGWLYHLGVFAPSSVPKPTLATPATLRAAAQARNFLIGAVASAAALRTDAIYSQLLGREYNLTEPGFETRFDRVRPSRAEFKFAESDAVIDFANANGMKVIGHPLVTPYQIPDWLTKGNFSPSEISAILKEYIQTMLRRYRGRIYSWDAATAIFDNLGAMSETFWLKAIGPDYVEEVLGWAREADPQVKLFLHDYNYSFAPLGGSSDAIYDLIRKLRARGTPVDGITMGLTLLLDRLPKLEDVTTNMKRLAALGLELHVEHFEMSVPLPPSDQDLQRQAAAYRDYLATCLSNTSCKAFLMWGLTDKDSSAGTAGRWPGMNVGAAMPFDAAYKPKPAYKAMLDALNDRRADIR